MGSSTGLPIDASLREGGIVVAASDRAARALRSAFNRARQAEGFRAWAAPAILDWKTFVREQWVERAHDERLLLSAAQEETLWYEIVPRDRCPAAILDGPRHRIAALAMEAHELLALHAPEWLRFGTRIAWQQDSAAFSSWLALFEDRCHKSNLLSASRLPLELIPLLQDSAPDRRPPLLLAGFDRIQPVQRRLLDAWGTWRETAAGEPATDLRYYGSPDSRNELAACALWCRRRMEAKPGARLLVVAQEIATRRGEMERTFLRYLPAAAEPLFEFTLGIPLSHAPLVKSACLLLRWLTGPLDENELDWLLSSGHIASTRLESAALQRLMRVLRGRGEARTRWTLEAFCGQRQSGAILPAQWIQRMQKEQRSLAGEEARPRSPIEWAERIPGLLRNAGWPGFDPLASTEYQAADRWQQALESSASLGFDGRRMNWQEFFSSLARILDATLFAPESRDAPIQIAGPAESAGLAADGIWFLGADENAWPTSGSAHPLVPLHVQREAGMPHASPKLDWELSHSMTKRLLASAPEVCFSHAQQKEGIGTRPSRLISKLVAEPAPLPPEFIAPSGPRPITIAFNDASRVPFAPGPVEGGAGVLVAQSQCPFKAFAEARLNAQDWTAAEAGLSSAQRGRLVHAVLHSIWSDPPPRGIRSLDDLREIGDREVFVAGHVSRVLREEIPEGVRACMPRRYLELEETRLIRLLCEWLDYESARKDFVVAAAESDRSVGLHGLCFNVRLDRIDRLNDGTILVVDYKTGNVSPNMWNLPRPENVQLPIYAAFALDPVAEPLGGLAFANVLAGENKLGFVGRAFSANTTLLDGLHPLTALARNPLTAEDVLAWRKYVGQLARDFIEGRAEVDPREYPKTCKSCGLPVLCRVHESRSRVESEDSLDEEGDDE